MKELQALNLSFEVSKEEVDNHKEKIYQELKRYNIEKKFTFEQFKSLKSSEILKIYNWCDSNIKCVVCKNPSKCTQIPKGYIPNIVRSKDGYNQLEIINQKCTKYNKYVETENTYKNKTLFNSNLIDENGEKSIESRTQLFAFLSEFVKSLRNDTFSKGAYIYGSSQVGKTYITRAFSDFLKNNFNVKYVYYPDLSRKAKSLTYSYDKFEKLVSAYKNIDILFIDGIGDEALDENVRDEFLGAILNHRLHNDKSTFFCSNYDYNELVQHFTLGNAKESGKSKRIVEQIKQMTIFYELK